MPQHAMSTMYPHVPGCYRSRSCRPSSRQPMRRLGRWHRPLRRLRPSSRTARHSVMLQRRPCRCVPSHYSFFVFLAACRALAACCGACVVLCYHCFVPMWRWFYPGCVATPQLATGIVQPHSYMSHHKMNLFGGVDMCAGKTG